MAPSHQCGLNIAQSALFTEICVELYITFLSTIVKQENNYITTMLSMSLFISHYYSLLATVLSSYWLHDCFE